MLHTIQNDLFTVTASEKGAELQSILGTNGTEYLWTADPAFWGRHSPVLFPFVGRTVNQEYEYCGKTYPMPKHGFAPASIFMLIQKSETSMTFALQSDEETFSMFPRSFEFRVTYQLSGNRLNVEYWVQNQDDKSMIFGIGAHPGFLLPGTFEDYSLHFANKCDAEQITFSDKGFVNGTVPHYPLENGTTIRLYRDLFLNDAIVLKNTGSKVVLENLKENHRITVYYPDMPYIGFWQVIHKDAPFLCIEPWATLPSLDGDKTVFENQPSLLKLNPGEEYTNNWAIEIG